MKVAQRRANYNGEFAPYPEEFESKELEKVARRDRAPGLSRGSALAWVRAGKESWGGMLEWAWK